MIFQISLAFHEKNKKENPDTNTDTRDPMVSGPHRSVAQKIEERLTCA
jgi:hypothetical protein